MQTFTFPKVIFHDNFTFPKVFVEGAYKTFEQNANIPNSYLAIDGIETGYEAWVPLWMFGLLY